MCVPAEIGGPWASLHSNACGCVQLIEQRAQPHMGFLNSQEQV